MGQRDVVQGTLEMLILKTLALEPLHGYGVATRIDLARYGGCRRPGKQRRGKGRFSTIVTSEPWSSRLIRREPIKAKGRT
jgi:hypothetical protein